MLRELVTQGIRTGSHGSIGPSWLTSCRSDPNPSSCLDLEVASESAEFPTVAPIEWRIHQFNTQRFFPVLKRQGHKFVCSQTMKSKQSWVITKIFTLSNELHEHPNDGTSTGHNYESVLWHRSTRPHCTTGNKTPRHARIPTNWDASNHIDCRHGSDSLTTPSNNQISLILARLHLPLPTTSPSASQRLCFVGMWDVPKDGCENWIMLNDPYYSWFLIFQNPAQSWLLTQDGLQTFGRPLERGSILVLSVECKSVNHLGN